MSHKIYDQKTVDETAERARVAGNVLHSYNIDPTNRFSLEQAAAAASVTPDEVLAVLEYKMRRNTQHRQSLN